MIDLMQVLKSFNVKNYLFFLLNLFFELATSCVQLWHTQKIGCLNKVLNSFEKFGTNAGGFFFCIFGRSTKHSISKQEH